MAFKKGELGNKNGILLKGPCNTLQGFFMHLGNYE